MTTLDIVLIAGLGLEILCLMKKRYANQLWNCLAPKWQDFIENILIVTPHLIPCGSRRLQFWFAIRVICIATTNVTEVLIPHRMGIVMDSLSDQSVESGLFTWMSLEFATGIGVKFMDRRSSAIVSQFWVGQIRKAVWSHTLGLASDFHSYNDLAEKQSIMQDADSLKILLDLCLFEFLPTVGRLIVAYFTIYSKFGILISLLAVLGSSTCVTLDIFWLHGKVSENVDCRLRAGTNVTRAMNQAFENYKVAITFNRIQYHIHAYGEAVDAHLEAEDRWNHTALCRFLSIQALQKGIFFALSIVLTRNNSSTGDMVFFTLFWPEITGHLSRLPLQYDRMLMKLAHSRRLLSHLKTRPSILDNRYSYKITSVRGELIFSHVRFSHRGQKNLTLWNISFSIKPRNFVALVGASGSGKTTILELFLRLYDPESGLIMLDGRDIKDLTPGSLRNTIGFVPSRRQIFTFVSIRQNLLYGKPDACDEDIVEACRGACIHEEIISLPEKYESVIGKDLDLSDGQIQRLEIARALVKKPRILVLDESTSHLDSETEASIFEHLRNRRCTILMAVNRLSNVKDVDQILVLQAGTIIERGKHDELMKIAGGVYQGVYSQWSR